jgi:hypothetical protein
MLSVSAFSHLRRSVAVEARDKKIEELYEFRRSRAAQAKNGFVNYPTRILRRFSPSWRSSSTLVYVTPHWKSLNRWPHGRT